jgi:hypothetical protein
MGGSAIVAINNMRRADFDAGLFLWVLLGIAMFFILFSAVIYFSRTRS